jgi:hypothetical protein
MAPIIPLVGLGIAALFLLKKPAASAPPPAPPRPAPGPGPSPGPSPPQPLPGPSSVNLIDPTTGLPLGPQPSGAPPNTEVNPGAIATFPASSVYAMINPVDPTTNQPLTGTVDTTQLGSAGSLNVHQSADLGSSIIGSLSHGDSVKITALVYLPGFSPSAPSSTGLDEKQLYMVQSTTGKTAGFVSSTFISTP